MENDKSKTKKIVIC
jgi:alpha-aminoadipic semialdehyde synthase